MFSIAPCWRSTLKRKASRLRDWNEIDYSIAIGFIGILEKKSISITRLKLGHGAVGSVSVASLKRKASRLRDWNLRVKENDGDYSVRELEKKSISITRLKLSYYRNWNTFVILLEKKSISITRLKLTSFMPSDACFACLKRKASRLRDWNVDGVELDGRGLNIGLEKKSISITRLKLLYDFPYPWNEVIYLEKKSISITRLKQDNSRDSNN